AGLFLENPLQVRGNGQLSTASENITTLFRFGESAAAAAAILGRGDGQLSVRQAPIPDRLAIASSFFSALTIQSAPGNLSAPASDTVPAGGTKPQDVDALFSVLNDNPF